MKLHLDTLNKIHRKHRKAKPNSKRRKETPKETQGSGLEDTVKVWGLLNTRQRTGGGGRGPGGWKSLSASPGEWGENTFRRFSSTDFKVSPSLFFGKTDDRERAEEGLTGWQAAGSTARAREMGQVGRRGAGQESGSEPTPMARHWPRGHNATTTAMTKCWFGLASPPRSQN